MFGDIKNSTEKEKLAKEYQQKYFKKLETRCESKYLSLKTYYKIWQKHLFSIYTQNIPQKRF